MRLMHPVFQEPILFREDQVQVLIVENPVLFREMTFDLMGQEESREGEFVLSLDYNPIDCAEHLHIVRDYYHLELTDRKIQSRFMAMVQKTVQEELGLQSMQVMSEINQFLGAIAGAVEIPTEFDDGDKLIPLLKASGFRISLNDLSPVEALEEYLSVYSSFLKDPCFVLIDAKAFFSEEELQRLYQMALYKKWRLLLLESTSRETVLPEENVCLIDKDLCLLRLNGSEGE